MEGAGVDACAADMLVTRTWLHHKHHCRLLRVSAQVERSMGGGSAAPCFAEARWEVSGAVLRGWSWVSKMRTMHAPDSHAPDSQVRADTAGLLRAKSAMHEIGWLEQTMEGADAAPCFLERLSEAMLQCCWRLAAD